MDEPENKIKEFATKAHLHHLFVFNKEMACISHVHLTSLYNLEDIDIMLNFFNSLKDSPIEFLQATGMYVGDNIKTLAMAGSKFALIEADCLYYGLILDSFKFIEAIRVTILILHKRINNTDVNSENILNALSDILK